MKKILYIIPILLLSILIVNNVYGYTVGSGTAVTISDISDGISYINNFPFDSYSNIYDSVYNGDYSSLFNSDVFKEGLNKHNYYLILYNKVIFYDTEFKCKAILSDYRKSGSSFCSLGLYPQLNGTVEYFGFNGETGITDATSLKSCTCNSSSSTLAAVFIYNTNGYYTEDYITSRIYSNFDIKYTNGESIIKKSPEFSFIPTYSENYETCNLKLDIKNPPDYYTLEYAINSSTSTWCLFDNSNGITIENNCLVIVRMLDENGDELFANSLNITLLDNELSSTYFKVDFDNSVAGDLKFTPILYYNFGDKFDLYLSINSSKDVYFTSNSSDWYMYNDKDLISNLDYFKITPANTYRLISNSLFNFDVTLKFKLVNKTTGVTGLERSFTFNMGTSKKTQAVSSTTNGVEDKFFHTGGSNINNLDESINNPFSGINNSSSFEDIASVAEESFTTFSALFSILPGFIWALVAGAIGILIVLRVLGR